MTTDPAQSLDELLAAAPTAGTPAIQIAPIPNAQRILRTMDAAKSANTLRVYKQRWLTTSCYFLSRGWALVPVQPRSAHTDDDRAVFVAHMSSMITDLNDQKFSLVYIQQILSSVRWFSTRKGGDPSVLADPRLREVMSGIKRQHSGETQRQARAFTLDELHTIMRSCPNSNLSGLRDRALILLGVATALRSANLTRLTIGDITVLPHGLEVLVRSTKTTTTPVRIPVKRNDANRLCPVNATIELIREMKARGATADSALFQRVTGSDGYTNEPMLATSLTPLLRRRLDRSGVSTEGISSHSLRASFITLAYAAQMPEQNISRISLHKDLRTLRSYDRASYWATSSIAFWGVQDATPTTGEDHR